MRRCYTIYNKKGYPMKCTLRKNGVLYLGGVFQDTIKKWLVYGEDEEATRK
jgi:hypothetical protein